MINKNIHQIWVGGKKIPSHIYEYMNEIKNTHSDFTYYLWTDETIPTLPPILKKIYDSYNEPAIKADLLRLYVVHEYGGIYLDADFKIKNKLWNDTINGNSEGFIVYNDSYKMSALANSIFGFSQNNNLLKYMIEDIIYEGQWIGPNWWAQTVCRYMNLQNDKIDVNTFIKKSKKYNLQIVFWKDVEDTTCHHHTLASWCVGSEWNNKLKTGLYD